jgi:glycerophosphoryl diester phosphodiesterase
MTASPLPMRDPVTMAPSFPQVVAHRGASSRVPEHTMTAYRRAIEQGAEALECDVRLTADGHLVCVHDSRIDRTSDGRGRVSNKTLTELQEIDFGSWREDDADMDDINQILTLDELLDLALAAPRRVELAIETKHPTRYGGYAEHVLAQTLQRYGLFPVGAETPRVRVMSFSSLAMRRMRELAPDVPAVYLMERLPLLMRSGHLPFGATAAGPSIEILRRDPDAARRFHEAGSPMHVWTVDRLDDLRMCMELGASAVITNRPGEVIAWRDQVWADVGS